MAVQSTYLRLKSFNVIDHLQSRHSRYRTVASSNERYSIEDNCEDTLSHLNTSLIGEITVRGVINYHHL